MAHPWHPQVGTSSLASGFADLLEVLCPAEHTALFTLQFPFRNLVAAAGSESILSCLTEL